MPGRSAAGHGEGKVPSDPAGAHQAGGHGRFCLVGTRARTWLGRAEAAPDSPPAHAKTSHMYEWVSAHPNAWGCLRPCSTCLLTAGAPEIGISLSLATLLLRHLPSSAMSHSIYGLPAPLTWVIRIYVLIGVNTKMGVPAINSQVPLRKIHSRAVLSRAWLCTVAQGTRGSGQESVPAASLPQPWGTALTPVPMVLGLVAKDGEGFLGKSARGAEQECKAQPAWV